MVDYRDIGSRIRAVRLDQKMTQEQLAEAVGVGVTHISHIELCIEVEQARPLLNSWLSDLVADCNTTEVKLITDTVVSLKNSLRRLKISEEQ